MRKSNLSIIKKSMVTVLAVALSVTMVQPAAAAKKKPSLRMKAYYLVEGESETINILKNGTAIKDTTWTSTNEGVFTVKKKNKTKAVITGVKLGKAKVKATVTTKAGKKITLTSKVVVDDDEWADRGGSWKTAESPEIDNALKAIIEKASADYAKEFTLEPIALLAVNESDGQTFRVFCKKVPVMAGGKAIYALVDFHANLLGEATVSEILESDMEAYGTGNASGWNQAETPVMAKGEEKYINDALNGITGVNYKPLAILASQKLRGTEYCYICEMTVVAPNQVPSYGLVYVSVDESGKVTLGDTKKIFESEGDQGRSNTDTALIGSWTYMLENTLAFTYTFKADGTGTYTVMDETLKFTYEADGKNLTIHFEKDTNPEGMKVPYRIVGSSLFLTDGTGSELEYKKS